MQNQMEASLSRIKSPGIKSNMPASPTTRNFATNRQSLVLDNSSNFLSPDSAANNTPGAGAAGGGHSDAAATLAHQRAKLKASNPGAAHPHRISAPVLASSGTDVRASWGAASSLAQVSESAGGTQEIVIGASRPKSSDFSGTLPSPHLGGAPAEGGDSWASMVNTPAIPLFPKNTQSLDSASAKLNEWNKGSQPQAPGVPRMGDPTIHRRKPVNDKSPDGGSNQHYDDSGSPMNGVSQQDQRGRNASGMRNASGGWGNRGQASSTNTSNSRFNNNNNSDDTANSMNGLGMQLGGLHLGMGTPQMPGMPNALAAMGGPLSPFNMNMLSAMALSPEAQLLAAQVAAANAQGYGHPGWLGMQPMSAGVGHGHLGGGGMNSGRRTGGGPTSGRSPGLRSATNAGTTGGSGGTPRGEEDVDPALLNDIPAWLRSLRLHKYTPNFEGMKWQDIVMMDEAKLEVKGVAALGARRKMLKTFEVVRKKMGMDGSSSPGPGAGNGNGMANGNGNDASV